MTAKTPWAHLPNAKHIYAIVNAALDWGSALGVVPLPQRRSARKAVFEHVVFVGLHAEMKYTRNVLELRAERRPGECPWSSLTDATDALIAWDSSADLLDCTPDVLRVMIDLAEPPVCHQAALLLPYAIVRMTK
jgi:hypothetical protein